MRQLILLFAAVALSAACTDPKYSCSTNGNCPTGTTCDTAQQLCVIAGGCTQICQSNELCVAAACVAQICPTCNANQFCDKITFKCVAVTDGTISLIAPAAGGVIGGASAAVMANAGAPNGGPLHVDFTLKSSSGATLSTVSVATGDLQGNYSGTLSLTGATTSTGNTLVATIFWKDVQGAVQQKTTGPTTVAIDETPPSISGIAMDRAYYSSAANPSGIATVTASIADTGGSAGVAASSVKLTVGSNPPVAGTLQSGSTTVYQFPVSLSTLGIANGTSGTASFSIAAADQLNNSGTATGSIQVDNIAPTLSAPSVPTTWFSGSQVITPALSVNTADTGGSGIDPLTAKVQVDASHGPYAPDTFSTGTASWTTLTGASFQVANTQGAVPFSFVVNDGAGNPATPSAQTINIDRKAPVVSAVTAPTAWTQGPTLNPSGTVVVTAVVDDTGGSGPASAALGIVGHSDVSGATAGTGPSRTYAFTVPVTDQTAGSETPVAFTVTGTDLVLNKTATASAGTGSLLIDDLGPSVNSITVNNGIGISGVKWFQYAATGDIDVQADIFDAGSGVKGSSLTLVNTANAARLDHGTPSCAAGATVGVLTCHFLVSLSLPTAGHQRKYNFKVAGTDFVNNPMQSVAANAANAASLGIDGEKPVITFTVGTSGTTTTYPANYADCNGSAADATLYCGHDAAGHFFRSGDGKYKLLFTVSDSFSVPDDVGSGADPLGGTCTIAGAATCAVTYDSVTGKFTIPADFSLATFASGADGTGTVSVTVNAKDRVGNIANSVTLSTIAVTRVKWVRSMAGKLDTFKGSPIVTTVPSQQLIVAGIEKDILGPLASLAPDGSILWRAGHGDVTNITNNVAYSSATKTLYVLGDNANKLFTYTVGASSAVFAYYCPLLLGTNGQAVGAPALINSGGKEFALVSDSALNQLWAFTGTTGSCSFSSKSFNNQTAWTSITNPPTTDGTLVYLPHDITHLSSVPFTAGTFGTVADAGGGFAVPILGPVSIASALFFGDSNAVAHLYSYTPAFAASANWTPGTSALIGGALNAPTVVGSTYAFAPATSGEGHFHAFNKVNPSTSFVWATGGGAGSKIGNSSAPALGADGVVYFSDDTNKELVPLQISSNVPSLSVTWASTFQGSAGQVISSGPTDTLIDSLGTEPTLDASGVLYFGTQAGKVYALITDSGGPQLPSAGSTWPRVGFDNCNSSNTAFVCQ